MLHRLIPALATGTALALAACGSGDSPESSAVTPGSAKALVERAAHLELVAEPVPADARKQGLQASFTNAATAVEDEQVIGLFVTKDADVAGEVSDLVRGSAPKGARVITERNVMVVYASAGSDRGPAVVRAVKAL